MRANAAEIASETLRSAPDLTVHDISHSDALWDVADEICTPEMSFTPLEAFVFGAAAIIHDLGLSPLGTDSTQLEGRADLISLSLRKHLGRTPSKNEIENPPEEVTSSVDQQLLRENHARKAEVLAKEGFETSSGQIIYILSDAELRTRLGDLIGKLAHSHYWPVDDLPSQFDQRPLSLPGFPRDWVVDRLKLACILRLTDAAQLDIRRAPIFSRIVRQVRGLSALHWEFQERLERPTRVGTRLSYACLRPFQRDTSQAWWLAYDYLREVDGEFRRADSLLHDLDVPSFPVTGVTGVETPERFRRSIPTDGWVPIDARLRVSDIPRLVQQIGGEALYGDQPHVGLRELVQNSVDAVAARQQVDPTFTRGQVSVHLHEDEDGWILRVEDNGIGMSRSVLTDTLLDFGSSLWRSNDARSEHPGLLETGWESIGRYGIGFYAVFLLGDQVQVCTNKYDEAAVDTSVLEFDHGVLVRPLLREASRQERLTHGGTSVSVRLRRNPYDDRGLLGDPDIRGGFIGDLCESLFPAIEVSLNVCDPQFSRAYELDDDADIAQEARNGELGCDTDTVIVGRDWSSLSSAELFVRLYGPTMMREVDEQQSLLSLERFAMLERPLYVESEVVGRLAVSTTTQEEIGYYPRTSDAVVCVGGVRTDSKQNFTGVIFGVPDRASRDLATVAVPSEEITRWANEQFSLLIDIEGISKKSLLKACDSLRALGAECMRMPGAIARDRLINYEEVKDLASQHSTLLILREEDLSCFETEGGGIEIRSKQTGERLLLNENVLIASTTSWSDLMSSVVVSSNLRPKSDFSPREHYPHSEVGWRRHWWYMCDTAQGDLVRIVSSVWDIEPEQLMARDRYDPRRAYDPVFRTIGQWQGGKPATLSALTLSRDLQDQDAG
ncbi:ATP-binding protein [Pseudonocardia sp. ICBG162]|uniref:HD domain-containing protein n=1 Tax=Pseudonocardia sp. ICBG162 TaxID=2846761 RepID=UPI001CF6657A|nr:ATP-binding protein [Pseudonocardia sp. ICBG162]